MNLVSWLRERPVSEEALQERRARRNKVQDARAKAYAEQMKDVIAINEAAERTRAMQREAAKLAKAAGDAPTNPKRVWAAAKAHRRALEAQRAESWMTKPPLSVWSLLQGLLRPELKLATVKPQRPATPQRQQAPRLHAATRAVLPSPVERATAEREARLAELAEQPTEITPIRRPRAERPSPSPVERAAAERDARLAERSKPQTERAPSKSKHLPSPLERVIAERDALLAELTEMQTEITPAHDIVAEAG